MRTRHAELGLVGLEYCTYVCLVPGLMRSFSAFYGSVESIKALIARCVMFFFPGVSFHLMMLTFVTVASAAVDVRFVSSTRDFAVCCELPPAIRGGVAGRASLAGLARSFEASGVTVRVRSSCKAFLSCLFGCWLWILDEN